MSDEQLTKEEKTKLAIKAKALAKEYNLPLNKVKVLPYNQPKGYPKPPTPWEREARKTIEHEAKELGVDPSKITVYRGTEVFKGSNFYDKSTPIEFNMKNNILGRNNNEWKNSRA